MPGEERCTERSGSLQCRSRWGHLPRPHDFGPAEVCPIDKPAREIAAWLLGTDAHTNSALIMDASARILRELADLAEANARRARAWESWTVPRG